MLKKSAGFLAGKGGDTEKLQQIIQGITGIFVKSYKFETPEGLRDVDVLMKAHHLRVERGDHHISDEHLADAIEILLSTRPRLTGTSERA